MDPRRPVGLPILVVDDDPSVGETVSKVLRLEGYDPHACTHPREAQDLVNRERFVLAFIDMNLPGMNGLELAARIREQDRGCEVIFITGFGTFENAIEAIRIGAYDYLRKPFNIGEIKLCLKRFQDRQALLKEIKLAEQRYTHLVENIPLLIYVIRKDLTVEFVNNSCLEILGFSPHEVVGSPGWMMERIHPADRERVLGSFQSAFVTGSPVSLECRLLHQDGHTIYTIVRSFPPSGCEEGHWRECLRGFMVDISDRVFLEKALVQKEKLKTLGAVSAEVAHEIRNPLVSIGGFARRLQKKFPDIKECGIILRESQRLEKILSRIRNYLKPVEMNPQACSANTILADCIDLMSAETGRKHGKCVLTLDPELPDIYVDPEILAQIFINLIRNAFEARVKGGIIQIRTFQDDQGLKVEFRNENQGTPIRNPETMFMPFDEGGQSFGLPLSYRLVKEIGGLLSFTQEGECALFTVTFPKEVEVRQDRSDGRQGQKKSRGARVSLPKAGSS